MVYGSRHDIIYIPAHRRPIDLLAASQGLLAVGVGDTAAALVGVWLSEKGMAHQLPPPGLRRKTWEGECHRRLIAFSEPSLIFQVYQHFVLAILGSRCAF